MKIEFSKLLLITDYLILIVLFLLAVLFHGVDFTTITVAWMAQIAVSSGFYYWKSKCDNRTKVPLKVIQSLPKSMREQIDLTQIITTIIQSE